MDPQSEPKHTLKLKTEEKKIENRKTLAACYHR